MKRAIITAIVVFALAGGSAVSQSDVPLITLGDSTGEGVQSADASLWTQPFGFFNLIAQQMRVPFPLPLILTSPIGFVGHTPGRARINSRQSASNLAVSGATVADLLNDRFTLPVSSEADLVLMPRTGTQIEIAEQVRAPLHFVWIGNNDVLGAILDWRNLNADPMTSVADFTRDYTTLVGRLKALNTKVVVGTIPDIAQIGFLFGPDELTQFLGEDLGLPQGSFTTLPVMLLCRMGLANETILEDPNYVLDPQEFAAIQTRTRELNQVITQTAGSAGFAVADVYTQFVALAQNPPVFYGLPLTLKYLGGLLSLDGIHPSNIAHALLANAFIQAADSHYGLQIPPLSQNRLNETAAGDPFIDWNGNLRVRGRPGAGILETLAPILLLSGDFNEGPGSPRTRSVSKIDKQLGETFKQQYLSLKGLPASTPWTLNDAMAAINEILGLSR